MLEERQEQVEKVMPPLKEEGILITQEDEASAEAVAVTPLPGFVKGEVLQSKVANLTPEKPPPGERMRRLEIHTAATKTKSGNAAASLRAADASAVIPTPVRGTPRGGGATGKGQSGGAKGKGEGRRSSGDARQNCQQRNWHA